MPNPLMRMSSPTEISVGNVAFVKKGQEIARRIQEARDSGEREKAELLIKELVDLWVLYGYAK
jgi:hypothetical protein